MQQKFEWLSQLDKMENPMHNLISVMRNAVSGIAHSEETVGKPMAMYHEVFAELDKAEEAIHNAVRKATDIAYDLERDK